MKTYFSQVRCRFVALPFGVATCRISSVNWSNVTSGIQDDGTTKTLIVNPPAGNRFYRLHKP